MGWMIFFAVVATVDAAASGFRRVAGHNARLDKRRYFWDASIRSGLAGLTAGTAMVMWFASRGATEQQLLVDAAQRAALVAVPFVGAFGLATLMRFVPVLDVRVLANATLFGPLTLARPFGIVACALLAMSGGHSLVSAAVAAVLAMVLW